MLRPRFLTRFQSSWYHAAEHRKDTTKPNIITLAWVGTVNSEPPMLSVSIRTTRHSHRQIMESKEFVVKSGNRIHCGSL